MKASTGFLKLTKNFAASQTMYFATFQRPNLKSNCSVNGLSDHWAAENNTGRKLYRD